MPDVQQESVWTRLTHCGRYYPTAAPPLEPPKLQQQPLPRLWHQPPLAACDSEDLAVFDTSSSLAPWTPCSIDPRLRLHPSLSWATLSHQRNKLHRIPISSLFHHMSLRIWNKMQPTNPNAVTSNTIVRQVIWTVYIFPLLPYQCTVDCGMRKRVGCKV